MPVWLYKAVPVPRVAYASVVWWPKTEQVTFFKKLEGLRGLALRGAVGAMLTASLGMLLGVPPLHLDIKGRAANSAYRLRSYGQWNSGTRHIKIPHLEEPLLGMTMDFIPHHFHFGRNWTVTILFREEWLQHRDSLPGMVMPGSLMDLDPKIGLEWGITVGGNVSVPGAVCDRFSERGHGYTGLCP